MRVIVVMVDVARSMWWSVTGGPAWAVSVVCRGLDGALGGVVIAAVDLVPRLG